MKKVLAVLLVLMLACSSVSFAAVAAQANEVVPVVILQGYSGPSLVNLDTGEKVWGLDFGAVGEKVKAELPNIAGTAGSTFSGDYSQLVDVIGKAVLEVMEPVSCNPDGTSKYNVTYTPQGAENTRVSYLMESGQQQYIAEKELVEMLGNSIGFENVFVFTYDWRMGQIAYADAINEYIQQVKSLTGSRQVDIFGLSHGGQCGASYLYYYGTNGDCRRACLNSPAIGGTTMVGDPMTGNPVNLDYSTILEFVELGQGSEDEWEWLIKYIGFEHLNEVVSELCRKYIVSYISNFGSIWDFVPLAVYEDALAYTHVNAVNNGALYENTERYHYEAMAHMSEGLQRAKEAGVTIAIMSNYGHENVTGSNKNSDYIIDTATSSGAYCAPFDSKFPTDYQCKNTNCNDSSHYHISPERNIDASCAYLPDNTWFVNGQFHGMYVFDDNTKAFVREFLLGNSITDVYSNSKYPQFMRAQNPADGIYIQFDNTNSGFHTSKDTKLLLTNLSREYDIKIRYISVDGSDIVLTPDTNTKIAAGQQAEISFEKYELPPSTTPFKITVIYTLYNKQNLLQIKPFEFTALSDLETEQFSYLDVPADINTQVVNLNAKTDSTENTQGTTAENSATDTVITTAPTTSSKQASSPKTGSSFINTASLAGVCAVSMAIVGIAVRKKIKEQ